MAIPSFSGFQKRARESEAKTNLGSVYTAEKSHYYENSGYSDNLTTVGFGLPDGDRYFSIGFTGGTACTANGPTCTSYTHNSAVGTVAAIHANCKVTAAAPGTPPTPAAFSACAVGGEDSSTKDWKMSEAKELEACGTRGCQ